MTEQRHGSECVQLICNLALMTSKLGRRGSALLPLRGQNNVQGSSDMGALPDTFTGYQPVTDDAIASLAQIKTLTYLNLLYTKITPAGVERLRQELPGCQISYLKKKAGKKGP